MAYAINQYCIVCGDCLEVCPNDAIGEAYPMFRINWHLCTECVGYAGEPQCVAVCPVEAIRLPSEAGAAVSGNGGLPQSET